MKRVGRSTCLHKNVVYIDWDKTQTYIPPKTTVQKENRLDHPYFLFDFNDYDGKSISPTSNQTWSHWSLILVILWVDNAQCNQKKLKPSVEMKTKRAKIRSKKCMQWHRLFTRGVNWTYWDIQRWIGKHVLHTQSVVYYIYNAFQ